MLLMGLLTGAAIPADDMPRQVTQALKAAIYEAVGSEPTLAAIGDVAYRRALGSDAVVAAEDFARHALGIIQRQRLLDPSLAIEVSARWRDLYE